MTIAAMEALDWLEGWLIQHRKVAPYISAEALERIDTIRAAFPGTPHPPGTVGYSYPSDERCGVDSRASDQSRAPLAQAADPGATRSGIADDVLPAAGTGEVE